jgi:two-component system chemotaxis response regulator CheY
MAIASPSILISDDDVEFRETLREMFEPQGYRTIVTGDGQEAVEIVRSESIHLVLLDLHMPRLSGLEVLQLIKNFNALLPCILMSAGLDEVVRRQAEQLAFSVLAKPVSGPHIRSLVEAALRRAYDWTLDDAGADSGRLAG